MFIQLLLLTLLSLLYYFIFKRHTGYWKKRDVVHENKGTSFGVIWDFIVGDRSLAEICKKIYDNNPNEPYVGLLWGSKPALLIRNPELIQHVLATEFQSFHSRGFVTNPESDLLADNILFMESFPRWKLMRQKLSPVFTSACLKNMFYILEHCGHDFASFVGQNANEDPFNLLYTYTTASIGSAVFGIDTRASNTMDCPFLEMSTKSVAPTFLNNLRFSTGTVWPSLFKALRMKIFGDHEDFFIGVVRNVLKQRRLEKQKRHDFIDVCVELQKNGVMRDPKTDFELDPTDELLAAQAFFFFLAGADTSANTMNFTLMELAQNPDVLSRLQIEIDTTFERCKDKPSYEDIDKLAYLDMLINEAMRKYPPIGLITRKCTRTTILPVGNLKVDKDIHIIIPIFALHRDKIYYKNPDVYDPERFKPGATSNQVKYTYLPFGEGNRVCIGARFARLQVKVGLASLLRRFTVRAQAPPPTTFERSFFGIRSTDKKYYSIEARKNAV